MISRAVLLTVALVPVVMTSGCLLTPDEVIPKNLRQPYFGEFFSYAMGDRLELEELRWSAQDAAYVDAKKSLRVGVAPAASLLEGPLDDGPGAITNFVVTVRNSDTGPFRSVHLLYAQTVQESGRRKVVLRGGFYTLNTDAVINHVVRHHCLKLVDAKQCAVNMLTRTGPGSLGLGLSQKATGGSELKGDDLLKVILKEPGHSTPPYLIAGPGTWQNAYNMLLGGALFRRFDYLKPRTDPAIGVNASPIVIHSDVEPPQLK